MHSGLSPIHNVLYAICIKIYYINFEQNTKTFSEIVSIIGQKKELLEEQVDILISKNQALQIYLKHHDNVYKTP